MRISSKLLSCLLALAVSLTACAAVHDAAAPAPETAASSTTTQTPAPTTEAAPQPNAPLTSMTNILGTTMGKNAVYQPMNVNNDGYIFATFIDFSTGQQQVLCHRSGCSHTDDSCPAFMAESSRAALIPVGDKLYWIVDSSITAGTSSYIDISDSDGQNRRRILESSAIPDLSYVAGWYNDGSAIYAVVTTPGNFSFFRIDESGLKLLTWKALQGYESYFAVGCWQDKLVVQHCPDYDEPELGDATTQEELDAFDKAWEAARDSRPFDLCLIDTQGNETTANFHWTLGEGSIVKVDDGTAYLLGRDGTVTKMDLAAGTSTTHQLDLPASVWSSSENTLLRDYIPVYMDVSDGDNNDFLLNLDTGEYFQLPTAWFKDQAIPRSPFVVAASDDMLLVQYNEIYYTQNDIGPDGQSYSFTTCRGEYGLISVDDYLAGSQNWFPVTLLGNDLV